MGRIDHGKLAETLMIGEGDQHVHRQASASGKTQLAVALAVHLKTMGTEAEIIAAD